MKRLFLLFFSFFPLLPGFVHGSESIKQKLDSIIKPLEKDAVVAVYVWDATDKKVVYAAHEDRLMLPCSCQKVIPALAAFAVLGPEHQLQTRLLAAQPLPKEGTVMKSPLALNFGGDPGFKTAHLKKLLAELKAKNIDTLEGPVYLEGAWSVRPTGDGWMSEDLTEHYAPPVSPALLDENKIVLRVDPTLPIKGYAQASVQGPQIFKVKSRVAVKPNASGQITTRFQGSTIIISGSVSPKSVIQTFSMPVPDPELFISLSVRYALKEVGIRHIGPVLWRSVSTKDWIPLGARASEPIQKLCASALKDSINPVAEALFLASTATQIKEITSWSQGGKAMQAILKKHYGVDLSGAIIDDGSGLSRHNLITPKAAVSLFDAVTRKPYFELFKRSLAINGEKGMLRYRLGEPPFIKRVVGKTGAMTGSCNLVCYLERKDKHRLVCFFGFSNFKKSTSFYRAQQDACCKVLLSEAL